MANEGLRHACADILRALAGQRDRDPRSAGRLLHGARMIEHAELLTYGEPVPADEVQARIDQAVADAEDEYDRDYTNDIDDATAEANIARGIAEREVEDLRRLVAPSRLARYDARKAVRS